MSIFISQDQVSSALRQAIPRIACVLPDDVQSALQRAQGQEEDARGRRVLECLCENARIAHADSVPLCQDTGTVWVSLEVGPDVCLCGDVFAGVDEAVQDAYKTSRLRMSVVRDALIDRANTGTNTPAFCEVHFVEERGIARMHVMLKGGGSDNASRVVMLTPSAGKRGIMDEVIRCVCEKGANACPPLVVGVGVGSTFDKVASLAKHALLRPLGEKSPHADVAVFEKELLEAVNATGVGPGGLGGSHTALAVHVVTAPCHIAALPLAINMGCSALRRITIPLEGTPIMWAEGSSHV